MQRRNLTDGARIELVVIREPLLAAQAKQRQREGGKAKVPQKSGEAKKSGETAVQAAKLAGVSHDTIRAARILETAVGEALGPADSVGGRGKKALRASNGLSRIDAHRFRLMAEHRAKWWPELESESPRPGVEAAAPDATGANLASRFLRNLPQTGRTGRNAGFRRDPKNLTPRRRIELAQCRMSH